MGGEKEKIMEKLMKNIHMKCHKEGLYHMQLIYAILDKLLK